MSNSVWRPRGLPPPGPIDGDLPRALTTCIAHWSGGEQHMNELRNAAACLAFAMAMIFTSPVHAADLAPPAVSVTAGLKQLNFYWNRVAGATRYQLWFLPGTGGTWVKYADVPVSRTSLTINISAHVLHWEQSRYVVKACSATACVNSARIAVSHLMKQTVGYFKPPTDVARRGMGSVTDLSQDGETLAAANERGGVEVFRKRPGGWLYEARLLGDPLDPSYRGPTDSALAVSGDGNVIVMGQPGAVRADVDPENVPATGAVYVFRRNARGVWALETKLWIPSSIAEDRFGRRVDVDESGTLLAAWRRFDDTASSDRQQAFVELFKYVNGQWTRLATADASSTGCFAIGLSGDGKTLVCSGTAWVTVFTAPGWQRVATLPNEFFTLPEFGPLPRFVAVSHDGGVFAVRSVTMDEDFAHSNAWANVYRRGATGWAREASLGPGAWTGQGALEDPHQGYAKGLALSRDGKFLAVGAPDDGALGTGVQYAPSGNPGFAGNGAVYVYERKPSGWRLRQFIKPNVEIVASFGWSLSFGRNYKDLAVGAPGDPSAAGGVGGDPTDTSQPGRGAVWLY
ncbi:MAG TPA: hypothetical protein VM146_10405 [Steroidobacteraceae bacterium]|nr:hypothetical protein [Steroidobacteraceae bacterium]